MKFIEDEEDNSGSDLGGYNALQQESSRQDMTATIIINELEFTSAPINADELLKSNSALQQKYENFQKELEEM